MEVSKLVWKSPNFHYDNMVRFRIPGDGSCFFHAVLLSFYKPYQDKKDYSSKKEIVKTFRKELSSRLSEKSDRKDSNSKIVYDVISNGKLAELSNSLPHYRIENLQKELDSDSSIDYVYHEMISNEISKDIYILDYEKKDVYVVDKDKSDYYKDRQSIVLLFSPGHYELVGLEEDYESITTLFDPQHPFIVSIRRRLSLL